MFVAIFTRDGFACHSVTFKARNADEAELEACRIWESAYPDWELSRIVPV